jgi:nucleotidyltransferase/DNA polymerase involved in DNA repair
MPAKLLVGHLDADCFYVSAERVRDSFLQHKPVGVLGNQGACVIAKSYEMKAAGVKTGEPIWDARRKCPDGVYLKRDFRWYEVLSRCMLDVVRRFSFQVEYYSIDEFFFQVEPLPRPSLQDAAAALRDRLFAEVGVPAPVGIARSKTLAKLVSDTAKPFGALALLDPEAEQALLADRPVTDVCGIGGRRAGRLARHGIHTALDLARADRRLVRSLLTVTGEVLWWELNGEPVTPLHADRPPHKALSRGGSLGESTADPDRLQAWLARNVERLVEELEYHVVATGRLQVYLLHGTGQGGFGEAELSAPSDRFDLLLAAARRGFDRAWVPGLGVSRMHLIATHLCRPGFVQRGLFEPPEKRARAVARLKREINARLGRFTLRSGATLPLADIYRDGAQSYDVCDIRGKMCF